MTVIDGEDSVDGKDGKVDRRTENVENLIEWMGRMGIDGKSTANRLERNSRSELYYMIIYHFSLFPPYLYLAMTQFSSDSLT